VFYCYCFAELLFDNLLNSTLKNDTMCAAFSEMERVLITERVKAGLDAAYDKGRKGGRPKALTVDKLKTLKSLVQSKEFSVTEICKMVGISRSVYYRSIAEFEDICLSHTLY
jgi:DNA invertase Pin-like site-specific DNA recombinase